MAENTIKLSQVQKRQRTERFLGIVAVGTMIAAWVIGTMRAAANLMPAIEQALPTADHFEELDNDLYCAWADAGEEEILGYVALGEAGGYGGPMILTVGVSPQGEILGATVASQKETPSWMNRVMDAEFVESFFGKTYSDPFVLENDVDGITGATYTSRAVAEAVMEGSRAVAMHVGLPVAAQPEPKIIFGVPEIVLLGLFMVGYFGHQPKFKYKKQVRWASMIIGMVFLGFVYNSPLTIAYINKFLLGFWPKWQTNLYWYILIGGILFVVTVDDKNPYCEWFCPFGAAQECMGAIGGAKVRTPRQYRDLFAWTQRGLAWLAIVVALIFRSPGLSSYEIFGTLFALIGSSVQFLLLGIILIAALFMRRPWCNYLCPLRPVTDMIRFVRRWVLEKWQNLKPKTAV
jgi:Na+-translocating ferredoxin:NAD+ oxidoreductase RnfG subunit